MKSIRWLFLFLSLVGIVFLTGCKGPKKSKEDLVEKGRIYEKIRQYSDAIKQYDEALKLDPFFVEAYLRKGTCYKEAGNFKEALAVFSKALVFGPDSVPLLKAMAETYYLLADYENSLAYGNKVLLKDDHDPFALNLQGKVKGAQGELEEGGKLLRRAVEREPENPRFVRDLAYFFSLQRQYDAALGVCEEFLRGASPVENLEISLMKFDLLTALNREDEGFSFVSDLNEKKPKDPEILLRLGQYYFSKEDLPKALSYAGEALRVNPDHLPSQILKGTVLLRQKKGKEALVLWQSLARHYPNLGEVQYKLAIAFEQMGQMEQAKTAYQRLVQMAPNFLPGQLALAQIYFRDGWHSEVEKICDKILEENPDHLDALKIQAASYLMRKNFAEAIPLYQRLIALSPEMEKNHALMAELYLANGNFEAALREAQEGLQKTPEETRLKLATAIALRYLGSVPQALQLFNSILEKEPDYVPARFNLGEIYEEQKLWSPAEEQYQSILKIQPNNLEVMLRLGKLYFKMGEKEKAESYFTELVKKYPEELALSFELGRIYADQKRIPEAIEKFRGVVERQKDHLLGNLLLANLYRQNGDLGKAEEILRQLMRQRATLNLENDLVLLMLAQGRLTEALDTIKSLTVVDQQRYEVQITKGFAQLLAGSGEEAVITFNRLQEMVQFDLVFTLLYADAYLLLGNKKKALQIVADRNPDFSEPALWYEKLLADLEAKPDQKKERLQALHLYLLFSYYQWVAQAEERYEKVLNIFSPNPLLTALQVRSDAQLQKWDQALERIDAILKEDPANSYFHFQQASVLWLRGDLGSSIRAYYTAFNLNPQSVLIRTSLIQILIRQGRWGEAEQLCRDTLAKSPERSEAYFLLADLLSQQGRGKEAVEVLKQLLEKKPEELRAALMLGQQYFNLHDYAASADVLKGVVLRDPRNFQANFIYLRALMAADRLQEANGTIADIARNIPQFNGVIPQMVIYLKQNRFQDALTLAQKVDPALVGNPASLYVLGLAYQANQDSEQARKHFAAGAEKIKDNLLFNLAFLNLARKDLPAEEFQKELESRIGASEGSRDYTAMLEELLKKETDDANELFELNMLYLSVLNYWDEQAFSELKARLREFPRNLFFYRIAFVLCDRNRWMEREEEILQQQLRVYPKDEFALMQVARLFLTQNKSEQALGLLKQVLEVNPENQEALTFLGMIHSQKGEEDRARALYEKALEINPNNVVVLNNLSYLYSTHKPVNLEKAAEMAERAQQLAPESGPIADTLGWIYFQQGRYAEALVQLQRARDAIPQVAEVRFHLGKTYLQLQDKTNAREELKEALRLDPKGSFALEISNLLETLK